MAPLSRDWVPFLKKASFFSPFNEEELGQIAGRMVLLSLPKGAVIFRQGDPGDTFFVVAEGKLKVSVREAFLFSRTLATFGPGDRFGEMAMLERKPRNATVTCEEASRIFSLSAEHFEQVLAENPAFSTEIKQLAKDRRFELDHKPS